MFLYFPVARLLLRNKYKICKFQQRTLNEAIQTIAKTTEKIHKNTALTQMCRTNSMFLFDVSISLRRLTAGGIISIGGNTTGMCGEFHCFQFVCIQFEWSARNLIIFCLGLKYFTRINILFDFLFNFKFLL